MTSTTIGYNGKVICTPFERKGVEAIQSNNFATAKHKTVLVGLTVLFGNGKDIFPGDVVFVNAEGQKTWGAATVELDGNPTCVCPGDQIIAVKHTLQATTSVRGY